MPRFLSSTSNLVSHLLQAPKAIKMNYRWGLSARNSIAFAQSPLLERAYKYQVQTTAISLASDPPWRTAGDGLASKPGSHKLFCVRPMPGKNGFLEPVSTVMSPHVQLIIQAAVSDAGDEKRKRFYEILSIHPHCRSLMGWLLEQQFDRSDGTLVCRPVIQQIF